MGAVKPFAKRRGTPVPDGRCDYLLAIDPGAHTGWALFDLALVACGLGEPPFDRAIRVVIELPQVYPSHPVPPNDLITLSFLAGRYAGRARAVCEVVTVFPHEWKGNLRKDVCAARVMHHLSSTEREIVRACDAPKGQMNNVLDAIGIGLFAKGGKL